MNIKHGLDFVFQDGMISMHVTVCEYVMTMRPNRYMVSYHNTMRKESHTVVAPANKQEAMELGMKKRTEMYSDLSEIWKDLNK